MTSPEVRAMFEASVADLASRSQPVSEAAREADGAAADRLTVALDIATQYSGGIAFGERDYGIVSFGDIRTVIDQRAGLLSALAEAAQALDVINGLAWAGDRSSIGIEAYGAAESAREAIAAASQSGPSGSAQGNSGRTP